MYPLRIGKKRGGNNKVGQAALNFANCCHKIEVHDLKNTGSRWTWSNGRKGNKRIKERLDRFLANKHWQQIFPKAITKKLWLLWIGPPCH